MLSILNCLGPPAAPIIVSPVQFTCDDNQQSRLVNVSWEPPSDTNCTNCTVLSTTTVYASHQLVCNGETTIAVELNCSETYNISCITTDKCGQQSDKATVEFTLSDQATVEITLATTGMYCTPAYVAVPCRMNIIQECNY